MLRFESPRGSTVEESSVAAVVSGAAIDSELRERRIEHWLVRTLENRDPSDPDQPADGHQATIQKRKAVTRPRSNPGDGHRGWARVRVTTHEDLTIVRILGREILRNTDIDDLGEELNDLVAAGCRRVVLDFSEVARLTSRIVAVLAQIQRKCLEDPEGMVRLCGLSSGVVEVFTLVGFEQIVPIDTDLRAALEARWPASSGLRPLPVTIISSLLGAVSAIAIANESESESESISKLQGLPDRCSHHPLQIHLTPVEGRARGRRNRVFARSILLGRDPSCDVRIDHETVSRRHASLEIQGGRLILCDLESRNGTMHNGRPIRGERCVLGEGDLIHVGPYGFRVCIDDREGQDPSSLEERVAEWVQPENFPPFESIDTVVDVQVSPASMVDNMPDTGTRADRSTVDVKRIGDVVVLTPIVGRLEDEVQVENLRVVLQALLTEARHRLVIDLRHLTHLSSRAIGVLLAHHLRLERVGGAIRLCHIPARVFVVLERVRLPLLLSTYSLLDEAVIDSWN